MSSSLLAIVFSFFLVLLVNAELYVVDPRSESTCNGGEPCTVTWLEDGRAPLLPSIGLVNVGLYTGQQQLIQALEPIDVSAVRAFTFTPNPAAGPNSGAYYIGFTSVNSVSGTEIYRAYSPWFRLERMTGSFETPLPSATEPISTLPSGSATSRPTTSLSTITVGTLSSSASPISTPGSASLSTSSPTSPSASSSPSEEASGSASSTSAPASSAVPSSSGFITSRTPAPSSTPRSQASSSSATDGDEPSPSDGASEDGSACSTPVSNRVAIFVSLMVALTFFFL